MSRYYTIPRVFCLDTILDTIVYTGTGFKNSLDFFVIKRSTINTTSILSNGNVLFARTMNVFNGLFASTMSVFNGLIARTMNVFNGLFARTMNVFNGLFARTLFK